LVVIPITDQNWADDFLRKISLGGYVNLTHIVTEKRKTKAIELARVRIGIKGIGRYNEAYVNLNLKRYNYILKHWIQIEPGG